VAADTRGNAAETRSNAFDLQHNVWSMPCTNDSAGSLSDKLRTLCSTMSGSPPALAEETCQSRNVCLAMYVQLLLACICIYALFEFEFRLSCNTAILHYNSLRYSRQQP